MFTNKVDRNVSMALLLFAVLLGVFISSCKPIESTNVNANANANMQPLNANTNINSSTDAGPTINAREPEKYSATLVFSVETQGNEKAIGIPSLSVQVARSGADRRVEFKLPDGTPLIYLDHENRSYVIAPSRKQYAELTKEATGIQPQKLMTAGQIVSDLKNKTGVERVGEEQINGRTAEKYRYSASTNTNTKAGEVKAEAFVFIDKETGLPLRTEVNAESSGDVKGVNAARVIAEMRDIKTDIDASLFEVPTGYAQVAPEKVRQQIDALTSAVAAVLRAMMANMGTATTSSPSPAATASPR
jgi:outer membrane lipoprotein-sorting protein